MRNINIKTVKEVIPKCYAYTTPGVTYHDGWTKIGYTEREVDERIKEQVHTAGIKAKIHWTKNATYENSNETFTDKEFHGYLGKLGVEREKDTEWFKISPKEAGNDFNDFRENRGIIESNEDPIAYKLRKEQEEAVSKTIVYFNTHKDGEFLWNAKPRFGKTISSYDLCMRMGLSNILVVTNRPAIANSWYEDYEKFVGANSGYYFVSHIDALKKKPHVINRDEYTRLLGSDEDIKGCIEFVSLQDIKGSKYFGGDYTADKLRELSGDLDENGKQIGITWDILIIDEAHEGVDTYKTDVAFDRIKRKHTLHLSGTPFKALARDKFPEEAIYSWTYADEQKAKKEWNNTNEEENPYQVLPQLNLYTYQMSEIIREKLESGIDLDGETEEYAFDLNEFFSTKESGKFVYEKDVDKFLDALVTQEKFPFSTEDLRNEIKHSFWILNRVDSAKELARKLKLHPVFKEYKIIVAAGDGKLDEDDENKKSYDQVVDAIKKYEKTITLSVGQLTTGITIPEWTSVLMLSNMKSAALYMQAAFRSQNPCLFNIKGKSFRKKNAYVFDFDPARTLTIFEEFANDLLSSTSGGRGDTETRKKHVRELLNFFPVYGEDPDGQMILLDAEKVLSIPRKIHAREVVNRGFMSNFLFANIGNIFSAPAEVRDIINKFQPVEEGKKLDDTQIDDNTPDDLNLNENNEVEIPEEQVIGKASDIFDEKIYGAIEEELEKTIEDVIIKPTSNTKEIDKVKEELSRPMTDILIKIAKESYENEFGKSTQRELENNLKKATDKLVNKEYSDWKIKSTLHESKRHEELNKAKTGTEVTEINNKFDEESKNFELEFRKNLKENLRNEEFIKDSEKVIVKTIETDIKNKAKKAIEDSVRDHLRGFSRTIPSFLMAYGDENTNLESFDKIVPDDVFKEVTSITLEEFRFLRDGGNYTDSETGEVKYFEGHLFDKIVFNDSVKEFLNKKKDLANYFDENVKRDIFDYIPPQKTNQIYTPKKVVKEMVDLLEEENPGCFDNPDKTFIDLYMKSGLYIAEIVKRLYRSEKMKELYPNDDERLNHIFAKQVYGLAPTEIIYQIAVHFVLGFQDDIRIEKHNLRKLDSLKFIQEGILEEKLEELFG